MIINWNDMHLHTPINLFWTLLNQPEIRLYLPLSDWFRADLTRFRKDLSVWAFFHHERWWIETTCVHYIDIIIMLYALMLYELFSFSFILLTKSRRIVFFFVSLNRSLARWDRSTTTKTEYGLEHIKLIETTCTQRNLFWILLNQPESDCIYQFPTDLDPNGHCPFGSKSVGNW